MKRLIFCFDGTWNKLDAEHPTNVVWTAESITPISNNSGQPVTQIIHYDQGVGTERCEKFGGGLMGHGLLKNLSDAYRFLIFNYEIGDDIYVFGFSRGAYSARSFVGLIRNCGLLERRYAGKVSETINHYESRDTDEAPDSDTINHFRNKYCRPICVSKKEDAWKCNNVKGYTTGDHPLIAIKYLGVWDTVGSLGVPRSLIIAPLLNKKYRFHDTNLSRFVESARHAVAIDEKRRSFSPTLWENVNELNEEQGKSAADFDAPYQQKWFPGTHGSVGGGGNRRGLSDYAMDWILDGARKAGLELDKHPSSRIYELAPNFCEHLENYIRPKFFSMAWLVDFFMGLLPKSDRVGPRSIQEVSLNAQRRWKASKNDLLDKILYRPTTLSPIAQELDAVELAKEQRFEPGSFELYTVLQGDSLRKIAKDIYGDAEKWELLYSANSQKIDHPDRIYIGMNLVIPNKAE